MAWPIHKFIHLARCCVVLCQDDLIDELMTASACLQYIVNVLNPICPVYVSSGLRWHVLRRIPRIHL